MRRASASAPAAARAPARRSHAEIDLPRARMQVEQALRELRHLGEAAGDGDPRHGMAAQIFQHAADEIAHVDQRDLGQAVQPLHRRLGGVPGRAGDMVEAGGARDIDAAMDRVDPGRAGIGHDDAGRAEDRQPADDAEPAVERLARQLLAAGDRDLDLDIAGVAVRRGDLGDRRRASSARGTGLIAGSPGGIGRPGRVTVPTPFAGAKRHARARPRRAGRSRRSARRA